MLGFDIKPPVKHTPTYIWVILSINVQLNLVETDKGAWAYLTHPLKHGT